MCFWKEKPKTVDGILKACSDDYNKVCSWIRRHIWYISDKDNHGVNNYWQTPEETLTGIYRDGKIGKPYSGDCLEENTYIITKEGRKKIKDISIGELILSYNYDNKKFEYKKVINKWNKGILDGYKVRLSNKHYFIATGNHKFFSSYHQKDKTLFKEQKLNEFDLTKGWKKKLHCVSYLPSGNIDINKDRAYLYGIYIAEGWSEGEFNGHVRIAQDKLHICKKIEESLNNLNIPWSESKRKIHHYYSIKKSNFQKELRLLGSNSFNKTIPEEILNWNIESLKMFIKGLLDGDGTNRRLIKTDNSLWEFSTSSDNVAYMFNIIIRKVYGNCWFDYILNHGGAGKKPIYRIRYNPESCFNRELFNGISRVSIREKKKVKGLSYYDIEVEDNHNFILADSGVVSHNCEDFVVLAQACFNKLYIESYIIAVYTPTSYAGNIPSSYKGHAVLAFKIKDTWYHFSNWGKKTCKGATKLDDIAKFVYKKGYWEECWYKNEILNKGKVHFFER